MKTKLRFPLTLFVASAFLLCISCKKNDNEVKTFFSSEDLIIRYGTSFGECAGYCMQQVEIADTTVLYTKSSWQTNEYPTKQCDDNIRESKWAEIKGLAQNINFSELDSVYGCPDCADGGAEWVEVQSPKLKKKVLIEYNSNNHPVELQNLLGVLRKLKTDCIDYYLIHNLSWGSFLRLRELGILEFLSLKEIWARLNILDSRSMIVKKLLRK